MQLRWLAVGGQIVTMVYVQLWLGIALPLVPMATVLAFLVCLNVLTLFRARQQASVHNAELFIELLVDVGALTTQLYLTGGAYNPFVSLYLLQVIIGTVLLDAWAVWTLLAVASLCFAGLTIFYLPIDRLHPGGDDLFSLHVQGMLVCFMLTACLVVFFVTRIQRNLEARDAAIAELRRRTGEEHHIVRMGLLASGAAHELGTPLATLAVILGDWQRVPAVRGNAEMTEEIGEMQAQVERCKAIVSGILLSAGDARGEGTVRTTLTAFLDATVEDWRARRPSGALDYRRSIVPDAPIVSDVALKQVIFNVLDNARDASPDWVGVTAARQGDEVTIAVRDAGAGFDPAMLAPLGTPYRSTKGRPGGGLGLFLVVNVVRKLGGTVSARNEPDGGASVVLALPLSALAPGAGDGR